MGTKRVGKPRLNWIHQTKKYVYVEKQHMFSYDGSVSQDKQVACKFYKRMQTSRCRNTSESAREHAATFLHEHDK